MAIAKRSARPRERNASIPPCEDCSSHACAFCAELREEGRGDVQSCVERVHVSAEQVFVEEGSVDADVVTLVDGMVIAFMSLAGGLRQVTGFHFAGDLLHWPRDSVTSHVTLQALTPASVCRIDRDRLRELCHSYPELADRLFDLASARIDAAREHIVVLASGTAEQRVASFLMGLTRRTRDRHVIASSIDLPMSRADIANYVGLRVETVSRMFTRLTSAGLLSLPTPNQVVITDRCALEERANISARATGAEPRSTHGGGA